jgi:uncharacterized membrane protein required for colicin V production
MNWSDYVVIGLIVAFALMGMFKGFIMSVYKLVAFVVCIFVSVKFSPILAEIIGKTPVYEWIRNVIVKNLPLIGKEVFLTSEAVSGASGAESVLGKLLLPELIKKSLMGKMPPAADLINTEGIVNAIGDELTKMIVSVLSLIVLYFVLRIALSFVGLLLKGVSELPVFKQVNKFGGFILGALQGLLAVYILCAILVLFNSNPGFEPIFDSIGTSLFARGFYENNFIINWLFRPVVA